MPASPGRSSDQIRPLLGSEYDSKWIACNEYQIDTSDDSNNINIDLEAYRLIGLLIATYSNDFRSKTKKQNRPRTGSEEEKDYIARIENNLDDFRQRLNDAIRQIGKWRASWKRILASLEKLRDSRHLTVARANARNYARLFNYLDPLGHLPATTIRDYDDSYIRMMDALGDYADELEGVLQDTIEPAYKRLLPRSK